jgi:preprotein translocase subunit SecB
MEKKIEDNSKYQIIANYIKDLSFEIPSAEKIHAEGCLAIIFKITDTKLKEEEIKRIILAEIPNLYGKKLGNIMTDLFQKSGFKEFRFKEEINFEKLYLEQTNINPTQKH